MVAKCCILCRQGATFARLKIYFMRSTELADYAGILATNVF